MSRVEPAIRSNEKLRLLAGPVASFVHRRASDRNAAHRRRNTIAAGTLLPETRRATLQVVDSETGELLSGVDQLDTSYGNRPPSAVRRPPSAVSRHRPAGRSGNSGLVESASLNSRRTLRNHAEDRRLFWNRNRTARDDR